MNNLSVTVEGLDRLERRLSTSSRKFKGALKDAQRTVAPIIQRTARNYAPRDQGQLHGSIQIEGPKERLNDVETSIGTNLKHARYQEEGTGIYGPRRQMIRPRNKRFLAWKQNGKWHFARAVRGVRPKRFMHKARVENTPLYRQQVRRNIDKAIKET